MAAGGGSVVLGGRRMPVTRPRARTVDGHEVPLAGYRQFAADDQLSRLVLERMLLDSAARAVLAEHGAHESFISEVAERAGVVEGSLYRFFSSKRDLIEKVAEDWYEEMLTDYQFGKRIIHHLFCPQCGVGAFSRGTAPDGRDVVAVNVRCLDEVDIKALSPTPFDGKNL